ncbi:MAG TPA: chemotaxis protein CheD [Gemmatirosa sp.]
MTADAARRGGVELTSTGVAGVGLLVVGIGDVRVTDVPEARLVTYALGSCLGVAIHDPVARVGGLLHVMLPDSAIDPVKAAQAPALFVDTGVPLLFRESYRLGARKERLVVRVVGGSHAAAREADDRFQIGRRNVSALRRILARNGVPVTAEDVGGCQRSRTVTLDVATGALTVRVDGRDVAL